MSLRTRQRSLWVHRDGTTGYRLFVIKHPGYLKAHVREVKIDPSDPNVYSYFLVSSWVADVGQINCKRVTAKRFDEFTDHMLAAAKTLVEGRISAMKEAS